MNPDIQTPTPARLRVDRSLCQSAATCLAYRFIELDDEAKAVILTSNGQTSDSPHNPLSDSQGFVELDHIANLDRTDANQTILEAAQSCPFNAIIVQDQTGQQLWPIELT